MVIGRGSRLVQGFKLVLVPSLMYVHVCTTTYVRTYYLCMYIHTSIHTYSIILNDESEGKGAERCFFITYQLKWRIGTHDTTYYLRPHIIACMYFVHTFPSSTEQSTCHSSGNRINACGHSRVAYHAPGLLLNQSPYIVHQLHPFIT